MTKGNQQHADRTHAVLSASGAERWMNCTPSARMNEKIPDEESDYAKEGELAHEIAESMLLHRAGKRKTADHNKIMKELIKKKYYYMGMIEDVEPYVITVLEQLSLDDNSSLHVEEHVDLSSFIPDGKGTCDAIVAADGTLHITDLKFGKGVRVSAVDNTQLKLYAVGALLLLDTLYNIHTVRLTIVQPRLDSVSVWDISVEELLTWANEVVRPASEIAFKGEGAHTPGDWCKFCKAKVFCPALKEEALMLAEQDFSQVDSMAPEDTEEGLLEIYAMSDRLKDFLDSVVAHIYNRALAGKKWPGYKLVEGRSNRVITDEPSALLVLAKSYNLEDITNTKIKGIGDLEKLMGKKDFNYVLGAYMHKPSGKPTLVEESDPRQEINSADDFI